jgi:hypothetical protein
MSDQSNLLRETLVTPPGAQWMFPDQHSENRPFEEAGIVILNGAFLAAVHPLYRLALGARDVTNVHSSDIIRLIDCAGKTTLVEPLAGRMLGTEAELNIITPDGDPYDLYAGDELFTGRVEHPELWRNTFEVDGEPMDSAAEAYRVLRRAVVRAAQTIRTCNGLIDPASARMQDSPGLSDTSPSPYIQALLRANLRKLGDKALSFTGVGIHEHHDVALENAPLVSGYLRMLAPFLNMGLHAAPFGFGEPIPRLGEILDVDELQTCDGRQPHSTRYLTRFWASDAGGVGLRVTYDNLPDALRAADVLLRDGHIHDPARLFGLHADVRLRFDAPTPAKTDHPGRLELCVKDTGVFRFDTLIAFGELARAVIDRLEHIVSRGEEGIEYLHNNFPSLFGKASGDIAIIGLERAHRNSMALAYGGPQAQVETGLGGVVEATEYLREIISFAAPSSGRSLSPRAMTALGNSVRRLQDVVRTMSRYRGADGLPSLLGYYETGCGTPSQWMIARSSAAAEHGLKRSADIMRDGTLDRAQSFLAYIGGATLLD